MGPDSPFAPLSPVLGLEIPFEKGFLENPFSPSRNSTFCPVLGLHGPFSEPSISFMHAFRKILVPNLMLTITVWRNFRRYAPVFPSPNFVVQFYILLASIFKCNLVRKTPGKSQTSFQGSKFSEFSLIPDFFPTPRTILEISVNLMRKNFEGSRGGGIGIIGTRMHNLQTLKSKIFWGRTPTPPCKKIYYLVSS